MRFAPFEVPVQRLDQRIHPCQILAEIYNEYRASRASRARRGRVGDPKHGQYRLQRPRWGLRSVRPTPLRNQPELSAYRHRKLQVLPIRWMPVRATWGPTMSTSMGSGRTTRIKALPMVRDGTDARGKTDAFFLALPPPIVTRSHRRSDRRAAVGGLDKPK